jgi:hypothetical protein
MSVFGSNCPGSSSHEKLHALSPTPSILVAIMGGETGLKAVSKKDPMLFEKSYRASLGAPPARQFKVALRPQMLKLQPAFLLGRGRHRCDLFAVAAQLRAPLGSWNTVGGSRHQPCESVFESEYHMQFSITRSSLVLLVESHTIHHFT